MVCNLLKKKNPQKVPFNSSSNFKENGRTVGLTFKLKQGILLTSRFIICHGPWSKKKKDRAHLN